MRAANPIDGYFRQSSHGADSPSECNLISSALGASLPPQGACKDVAVFFGLGHRFSLGTKKPACLPASGRSAVEKVYLYPNPADFRKSIDGLAALVVLDIKFAVFDPPLFVFLNKPRKRVKILYWERNGFSFG